MVRTGKKKPWYEWNAMVNHYFYLILFTVGTLLLGSSHSYFAHIYFHLKQICISCIIELLFMENLNILRLLTLVT
jgi:hypothetical protein